MIKRERVQVLYVCLLSIFLSFLVLLGGELVARTYKNGYYLPARNFWRLDHYTNLAGQFDGKEKFVLWHTGVNFNEEVVARKPRGVTRIIVLGTSSTEGFRVPREDNYVSQLQRLLDINYGIGKYEVINAAIGGAVSYQLLIYFQEVLLKLSPDMVIIYLGFSENLNGPFTTRDYYKRIKRILLDIGNDHAKKARLLKYGLNGLNPLYPVIAESRLFGYILVQISENFSQETCRMPTSDREYVLKEFIALSKQHNFKLILAPEVVRRCAENIMYPYYSLMKAAAESGRVSFLDIMPLLRAYPDDKVFLDNNDLVHLNKFGHQLVGERLFEQVKEEIHRVQVTVDGSH